MISSYMWYLKSPPPSRSIEHMNTTPKGRRGWRGGEGGRNDFSNMVWGSVGGFILQLYGYLCMKRYRTIEQEIAKIYTDSSRNMGKAWTKYWAGDVLFSNNIAKLNLGQIVIFSKPPNIIATNISGFTVYGWVTLKELKTWYIPRDTLYYVKIMTICIFDENFPSVRICHILNLNDLNTNLNNLILNLNDLNTDILAKSMVQRTHYIH